ncbi:hypothetical protein, conserved [Plasmodium malariae]|uniref:Uncharacterized protein n=1 Tax=Plasmodium malariae TaxID=5858 RepID=A0A1A8WF06_PLAMA|nr:hypothetical protein, conserved [Plasmodium malariae]
MEEGLSTIKKIKSNMSKICFNKSNKLNADFKDDHIEIILDNKNITPKPIYFSFQETETKKSFDQIDHLLKHFDDKNEGDTKKDGITESYDHEKIRGILDENLKISLEKKKYIHRDVKLRSPLKYVQDEKDILESYDEILLSETETITLLNIPNVINDIEEEKLIIEEKNKRYEKLLNNDENNYINKSMQTLNVFRKNKDVYVSTISKQNRSSQTNLYELSELLHKKFIKYRNKKLKKIMDEYGDSLNINERIILKKNMWVQVVDKNVVDNKHTTIIPKSFYKSKKNNTSLFNTLFLTKNMSRTLSNKSRTFRTKNRFKNMKTMKFLTSSFSEDEYLIKSIIKKKKEQNDNTEEGQEYIEDSSVMPWQINNPKKNFNKTSFVQILKTIEKHIVQNIYSYEQMIYKNINVNYLSTKRKDNTIKMFDGENYDALTNPNINYKKKKIIVKIKIKNNFKKLINFHLINKDTDTINEARNSGRDINERSDNNLVVFLNNNLSDMDYTNLLKERLDILSKRKKKKINKEILSNKLRKEIRKRIKKKKKKEKTTDKKEDSSTNLHMQNVSDQNKNSDNKKELTIEIGIEGENKPEKDHQILDIITNEESKEDKINKINTLIIDDVLKNNCNEEKKKQISVKENIEKKRISYVIKKKEKFSSINGNRIKISTEVKQDDYSSKYNYDNDDIVYYKQNGEYNENRENNMLYNSKVKKYIKNISIDKLFQFHYKNLEKIVTSIDTNKFYQDYITASYSNTLDIGSFQNSKGNIAIFSFLNPTYPLKLYNLNTSVMKIKYSNINPNILVAALCNGHIDIYDIRNSDKSPVLKSTTIKNYYENCFEPIYDFSFKNSFATNNTLESVFYSAHENGFVYQWNIEKELKNKEILYLKNKKNDLYQDLSSVFENKNHANKPFNSSITCIDIDNYMHHDQDFIMSNIGKDSSNNLNEKGKLYDHLTENCANRKNQESVDEQKQIVNHVCEGINNKAENTVAMNDIDVNNIADHKSNDVVEKYTKQISKEEELLNHYKNITENIIDKKIKPTHSYYYLGTKNGIIYRCNSCYQKSYLNYYVAHFGTVNKIKINKFDHDIFLSAGDDCTVKLWSKFCNNQITTFKSKNSFSSINDILWLPNNSTSFICCSDDGRVELWDFDFFSKDPLIIFYPNPVESSRIISLKMFNKNDILLCGDNLANVSMTKIKNLFNPELDDYEQKMKLTNCLKNLDTYDYF